MTFFAVSPPCVLDEVAGLDEHAARTAGRIEDDAVVGLDDVDDRLHERGRREELAVVVRLLDGELGEEILVDAAEDVAGGLLDLLAVEQPHQVFEHLGLEDAVVLRQHAGERLELGLDGRHGLGDEPGQIAAARGRLLHDPVVAGLLREQERAAARCNRPGAPCASASCRWPGPPRSAGRPPRSGWRRGGGRSPPARA